MPIFAIYYAHAKVPHKQSSKPAFHCNSNPSVPRGNTEVESLQYMIADPKGEAISEVCARLNAELLNRIRCVCACVYVYNAVRCTLHVLSPI